ncbi:hypothetical protein HO173_000928 [Letharia columbiana]|uniref:Uncharacterized protein n=1 Tax=Letharia columbiana TaxID=112416 RepID=A0A8H6G5U2_9LECA|nr:uncharacterized protein HO173_000928 [Letharia columbiana]KAF6241134.1 hypothetical protein HO173_000928 [Letharia columbiana]
MENKYCRLLWCHILNQALLSLSTSVLSGSAPPFGERHSAPSDDNPNNAYAVWWRGLCGFGKDWIQQLGEEERRDVVGSELQVINLASFCCFEAGSRTAALFHKNIMALVIAEDGLGGAFNGCEIIEVEMQEDERAFGFGDMRFDR